MKVCMGLLILIILMPFSTWAMDMPKVTVNGFVSQGYLKSNNNNFLSPDSMKGTTQFTEAGLVISSEVTDKLHIGMSLLSRDLGNVGNNAVKLDWGFADYSHNDYLGLRVGKVKRPYGFYNEGRDTDMLRSMIFLPQSIYDETKRDLMVAYQGAGLYGTFQAGLLGYLDYQIYGGNINFDEDSLLYTALRQNGTYATRKSVAPSLGAAWGPAVAGPYIQQINIVNLEVNNNYTAGGSVTWNTSLDGLRLGASVLTVENDINYVINRSIDPTIDPTDPLQVLVPTPLTGSLNNELTWVASVEYGLGNLLLSSEYSETDRNQTFNGYEAINAVSQSYYVMGAYTFLDSLTFSLLYDVYYADKNDKDGEKFAATSPERQDFFTWRKDFGVGVRYDINPYWLVKAEYHVVDGAALFLTTVNDPNDLVQDWDYFSIKMSFNF